MAFLEELRRHFRGRKLILMRDGLPAHRSRDMSAYLASQSSWLTVERLPGYALELNPVEYLWGNVKGQEQANLCAEDLSRAATVFRNGVEHAPNSRQLRFSFLSQAGLSF